MKFNRKLATSSEVQKLQNLGNLSDAEREELRSFFVEHTKIPQLKNCHSCVKIWAKYYRNNFNHFESQGLIKEVDEVSEVENATETTDEVSEVSDEPTPKTTSKKRK